MPIKVYASLDEALQDIQFNGTSHCEEILNGHGKFDYGQPALDSMITSLEKDLKKFLKDFSLIQHFFSLMVELVSNSYRHELEKENQESFRAEYHVGTRGALMGTRQKKGFFTPQQIESLKQGKNLKGTRANSAEVGTYFFVKQNGLWISEQEKAIFIARYFENTADLW